MGKTWFLQNEFRDFKYLNLDNFDTLKQATTDPESLWMDSDRVIIDECQKSPHILNVLKIHIDRGRAKKRFLLSGSANLLLMKSVSETLAGRAVYFNMYPMINPEISGRADPPKRIADLWNENTILKEETVEKVNPIPLLFKGFMPPLLNVSSSTDTLLWWEGYVKTYLERDLRELSQVDSLVDFRKVMEVLAPRTGGILNQSDAARDAGISQPTVFRYIKLLEVSNIIERVHVYERNRTKRITKAPKLFFLDPALASYLSGYHSTEALSGSRELGGFFETMIFLHLKVIAELMVPKASVLYWKTASGREVDFVLEHGRKALAVEAKMTRNPTVSDAANLLAFIDSHKECVRGILIHNGEAVRNLHRKIVAAPWWWLFE